MNKDSNRYIRQIAFHKIGAKGQDKLISSRVAIVGMGALGSAQANMLCRAGIGCLRLIDPDTVELNNLQRQVLYTQKDAEERLHKAAAAKRHLEKINSEVKIETAVARLTDKNAAALLTDVDLVMDATDNMDARYLINKICVRYKIPWVYGGVVQSEGMTMNILPGGPCFCCMTGKESYVDDGENRNCATLGVLNTLTSAMASVQCTEAMKILTGSESVRRSLLLFDIWENEADQITVEKDPQCPVCGKIQ